MSHMMLKTSFNLIPLTLLALTAISCGGGGSNTIATDIDASPPPSPDASLSCLDAGREAGERYSVGDDCNFCDCNSDGSTSCTSRDCSGSSLGGCDYNGTSYDYGQRFMASDSCNECVCAASGLACTRRTNTCPNTIDEGAIILETMDEECGIAGFTGQAVLDQLPFAELTELFEYRDKGLYPETLADTQMSVRIVRDEGYFVVCRIPREGQEAIDMEVLVEVTTEDGSFDETLHTYLRRNAGGFTDVWTTTGSFDPGTLNGTHTPNCIDFGGYGFSATIDADKSARGSVSKLCETDLFLDVGEFNIPASN